MAFQGRRLGKKDTMLGTTESQNIAIKELRCPQLQALTECLCLDEIGSLVLKVGA
jgi:hypothetical protein